MVIDLFTLIGLVIFVGMLAALIATHDFRHHPSAGGTTTQPGVDPRRRTAI